MDLLRDPNQMNGQPGPGNQPPQQQQQPPQQEQQPQTLIQRSFKAFKTMTFFLIAWEILGIVICLISGNWMSIIDGAIQMVGIWVAGTFCCFTIYPWLISTFYRSKKAGEQFWNQKY